MKKLIIILIATLFAICPIEARTFALLAAVSNYGGQDKGDNAHTTNGAKAFRDVLATQTQNITLLTSCNANRDNIVEKLELITKEAKRGDRIIFFFNGHGYPGGMACHESYMDYSELVEMLGKTKASEVFVFINACHSGSVGEDVAEAKNQNWFSGLVSRTGHVYMLSSRGEELSWSAGWLNKSWFTQALLTGYRGKADTNHDRKVTVMELFTHIHKDVVRRSEDIQHPVMLAPKNMYDVELIQYDENGNAIPR